MFEVLKRQMLHPELYKNLVIQALQSLPQLPSDATTCRQEPWWWTCLGPNGATRVHSSKTWVQPGWWSLCCGKTNSLSFLGVFDWASSCSCHVRPLWFVFWFMVSWLPCAPPVVSASAPKRLESSAVYSCAMRSRGGVVDEAALLEAVEACPLRAKKSSRKLGSWNDWNEMNVKTCKVERVETVLILFLFLFFRDGLANACDVLAS